jgi:angio-associated migratory cell protein
MGPEAPDTAPGGTHDDEDPLEIHEEDADEVIVLDGNDSRPLSSDADDSSDEDDDSDAEFGSVAMLDDGSGEDAALPVDDAVLVLRRHKEDVLCVAASPADRRVLASGGQDEVGALWDLEDGEHVGEVDGGGESVSTVAFSADGSYAAFGSENGAIAVVLMNSAEAPTAPLDGPGDAIHFLAWHPRGPLLLAGSEDCVTYMWNAAKAKFLMAFAGHEAAVTAGGFSGDGKLVVTASLDMSLRVWNPTTGETLKRVLNGLPGIGAVFHTADLMCLSIGPADTAAGKLVATGCGMGDVFVTQMETGTVVTRLQNHAGGVESVAFSSGAVRPVLLATGGGDGVVHVWDSESGVERCKLEHNGVTVRVVWHPSLPLLGTASADGTVALWDALGGSQLALFRGHTSFVTDMCFAAGNDFLASSSADGTVRIFDVRKHVAAAKAAV